MNTDIIISFMVAGGLFAIGVLAGFIIGRATCSCRKAQRQIEQYRREIGAGLEDPDAIVDRLFIGAPIKDKRDLFKERPDGD